MYLCVNKTMDKTRPTVQSSESVFYFESHGMAQMSCFLIGKYFHTSSYVACTGAQYSCRSVVAGIRNVTMNKHV